MKSACVGILSIIEDKSCFTCLQIQTIMTTYSAYIVYLKV